METKKVTLIPSVGYSIHIEAVVHEEQIQISIGFPDNADDFMQDAIFTVDTIEELISELHRQRDWLKSQIEKKQADMELTIG